LKKKTKNNQIPQENNENNKRENSFPGSNFENKRGNSTKNDNFIIFVCIISTFSKYR
jgi:hypothetical protein